MMKECCMSKQAFQKYGLMKTTFHSMNLRDGLIICFMCIFRFKKCGGWEGFRSFPKCHEIFPTHSFHSFPTLGNSPKESTMQCWKCKCMLKCFSNGSCDAQHGHKGLRDFSPISGRKRSAISESAFNMSVAIGRLSEKRGNKLFFFKRKGER